MPRSLRLSWILVAAVDLAARAVSAQPAPAAAAPVAGPTPASADGACAAHAADCDWLATLGSLERQSMTRALAARGLTIEPMPWGKVIEDVHVYNEDVFAEGNGVLKFFNHFHVTTKEHATRGELVISTGEVWDQARIEESARRLRDPLYSSVVAIVPVHAKDAAKVSMLVVTRDIWSLRLNTTYTFQQGSLTNLAFSLSENNFIGQRNTVAAAVTMDQGAIAVGPLFIDKNVAGSHIDVRARVDDILTRRALVAGDPKGVQDGTLRSEGTDSTLTVSKPLWSLASEWGWSVSFGHSDSVQRQYLGVGLRPYDDPDTATKEALPTQYRLHYWSAGANAVRQWGTRYKSQLSFGHSVASTHPFLLPNFTADPELRAAFVRDVFPRSEVTSVPFVEYSVFEPRFRTVRDVSTYDLAEDARLGFDFDASAGVGLRLLGSTSNFERGGMSVGYTQPWCHDGFARLSGAIGGRLQDGAFIDNTASTTLRVATPTRYSGRLIVESSLATRWNDTQNAFYAIGSDSGLRGFLINQFIGQRRFSTQVEVRSTPYKLWVLRVGGVAFYELGGAADTLKKMPLFDDVGVGVRVLVPQTSRELFRFDLAVPLNGPDPGSVHFIAGFSSYF